jgi:hypothetical protein
VQFILRTNPRRETSPEGTRRARKRRKNFSRQILNTGPTAIGSARSCTTVSRVKRTGVFFFLRNPDVILTFRSRDTWRASQRPSAFQSSGFSKSIATGPRNSQNRDTRNPDKILAVYLSGHVASIAAFIEISEFRFSKSIATGPRNSRNRDT